MLLVDLLNLIDEGLARVNPQNLTKHEELTTQNLAADTLVERKKYIGEFLMHCIRFLRPENIAERSFVKFDHLVAHSLYEFPHPFKKEFFPTEGTAEELMMRLTSLKIYEKIPLSYCPLVEIGLSR